MTLLERIIRQQVSTSVVQTVSRTVDRVADTMADEILRDPVFRAELQELIRIAFRNALAELHEPSHDGGT
jgi:hypothetical protein